MFFICCIDLISVFLYCDYIAMVSWRLFVLQDNDFEVNIDEKENKVVEKMETEENIQEKRQAV